MTKLAESNVRLLVCFFALSTVVPASWAQAPRPELAGGELDVRAATGDIGAELSSLGNGWGGYAVPMVSGHRHHCGGGTLSLDDGRFQRDRTEVSGGELFVLYRVSDGRVTKIRTTSSECRIDAGASRLVWLEGVASTASLGLLSELASGADADLAEDATSAIAFHADRGADALLGRIAASAPSKDVREKAIFWLGAARGQEGFSWLERRFDVETDSELKEKIVFALHVSDAAGSTEKLVEIARHDDDGDVRERALFWLAQEAGKLAASTIANAVNDDPDTDVKKKAVFALSQLPPEEGIPLLIEVAETHPNPEVRKKAFFWLGQTNDPRAAALFEKILLSK